MTLEVSASKRDRDRVPGPVYLSVVLRRSYFRSDPARQLDSRSCGGERGNSTPSFRPSHGFGSLFCPTPLGPVASKFASISV